MKQVLVLTAALMATIISSQAFAQLSLKCSVSAESPAGSGEYTKNLWYGTVNDNESIALVYDQTTKAVTPFTELQVPPRTGDKLIGLTISENKSLTLFIGVLDANMSYSDSSIASGSVESPNQALITKGLSVVCIK